MIAVWLTFPSRSLADFSPLLALFPARHRVDVARSLVDELWPVLSPGGGAPDPALHQLQLDLSGGSDAASFSPEYRNSSVSSLIQGLSLIAEGLADDSLSRFAKASWALMADFSAASKSRCTKSRAHAAPRGCGSWRALVSRRATSTASGRVEKTMPASLYFEILTLLDAKEPSICKGSPERQLLDESQHLICQRARDRDSGNG